MFWDRIKHSLAFRLRARIKSQIIILESDDWGMERAASEAGIDWAARQYGREKFSRWTTDARETADDLRELFGLFKEVRPWFAKPPVVTANFITHTPVLDENDQLRFVPLSQRAPELLIHYREAMREGYLCPQYHGFCHFNSSELEDYTQSRECREAHRNGFMLARSTMKGSRNFLHGELSSANRKAHEHLSQGLSEFGRLFGGASVSLIPPTYILDHALLPALVSSGIRYIQGGNQLRTNRGARHARLILRQKDGIYWGVRNARIDPHPDYGHDHEVCLKAIEQAFTDQLPAVIDFHRVNFSGAFTPDYRDRTLTQLRCLFHGIRQKWPDASFMSTPEFLNYLHGAPQSN